MTRRDGDHGARRFDWHVLLPRRATPHDRWLVLGAPAAVAYEPVQLGLTGAVVTAPDPDAPADVVALLDGAQMPRSTAARVLDGGGTLYWEVDRRGLVIQSEDPQRHRSGACSKLLAHIRAAILRPT